MSGDLTHFYKQQNELRRRERFEEWQGMIAAAGILESGEAAILRAEELLPSRLKLCDELAEKWSREKNYRGGFYEIVVFELWPILNGLRGRQVNLPVLLRANLQEIRGTMPESPSLRSTPVKVLADLDIGKCKSFTSEVPELKIFLSVSVSY
jgi:hypothetical protein